VPTEPHSSSTPPAERGPAARGGPPPLAPFGLVLHHDGRWTHEGRPISHAKLRAHFDRSVRFLPDEAKYVVTLRHFRGQIEVEEAAFFVRAFDPDTGLVSLSDRSEELLDPATLARSPIDGALLCRVKRDLALQAACSQPTANEVHRMGVLARFGHAAHAELLNAVEEGPDGLLLRVGGIWRDLPDL
jgi:hypothetical protein